MNLLTKEHGRQVAFVPTEDEHAILKHALTIQYDEHSAGKRVLDERSISYYVNYLSLDDLPAEQESEVSMQPFGFIDFAKALEYAVHHRRYGPTEIWLANEMAQELRDYAEAYVANRAQAELARLIGDLIDPISQA